MHAVVFGAPQSPRSASPLVSSHSTRFDSTRLDSTRFDSVAALSRLLPQPALTQPTRARPSPPPPCAAPRFAQVIEQTMEAHQKDFKSEPTLEDIIATDAWARQQVKVEAERLANKPILL